MLVDPSAEVPKYQGAKVPRCLLHQETILLGTSIAVANSSLHVALFLLSRIHFWSFATSEGVEPAEFAGSLKQEISLDYILLLSDKFNSTVSRDFY